MQSLNFWESRLKDLLQALEKYKGLPNLFKQIEDVNQKKRKGTVSSKLFRDVSTAEKLFVYTIFKSFALHVLSKQYCSLLFVSKKESI